MVRAWESSGIVGLAVHVAASSAGRARLRSCRSPMPPMFVPRAACCRPKSVKPVAMRVGVMSSVQSALLRVSIRSEPYIRE